MNFKKSFLYVVVFLITIVAIKSIGIGKIPINLKILVLIIGPIFLIWMVLKYKGEGKKQKYIIISFLSGGVLFYLVGVIMILQNYYNNIFVKYRSVLVTILLSTFILTIIIVLICRFKIGEDNIE
jgi:hypothetical protein